ncbi:MAG: YoaK family protein [Saprospiraceae bacterium]|nr:YoaK family protein [Saprospiraceae bacterium]
MDVKKTQRGEMLDPGRLLPPSMRPQKIGRKVFRVKLFYALALPLAAGNVIYAGLMTFSIVVTNITSLLPELATDLYEGDWATAGAIFALLFAFFMGGFASGFFVEQEKQRHWRYFHLLPLLFVVGFFVYAGLSTPESIARDSALAPAGMFFSVGVLNSMVGLRISSLLKASQITGVVNELGVDLAEILHARGEARRVIKREAFLRFVTMLSFVAGAMLSVALFPQWRLQVFLIPAAIVMVVVIHDLVRF